MSFRLSDEEYEALMEGCISQGARSISEYARAAACWSLDQGRASPENGRAERAIRKLRYRVEELDRLVRRLSLEIDGYRAFQGEPVRIDEDEPAPPPRPAERRDG